ncbi:MAG: hypothetical protein ABW047_07380 [Nitrospiraceae bacterium]
MEQQELNDFRDQLLNSLEEQPRRTEEGRPRSLQIFVNHECVGSVDCMKTNSNYSFSSRDRSIHTVELRNEAGVLVGGLCASEAGLKNLRVPIKRGWVDIHIYNRIDGGSVRMRFENNRPWWSRLGARAGMKPFSGAYLLGRQPLVGKTFAYAQILLVISVAALLVDRVPDWFGSESRSSVLEQRLAAQEATHNQVERLQQQVAQLSEVQQTALKEAQFEQQQLAQLSHLFDNVSQAQSKIAAQVVTTQEDLRSVKDSMAQEVENDVQVALTKEEEDRIQVKQELQSVKSVNETLIKQVALLESKNRELHARLTSTAVELAKVAGQQKSIAVARNEQSKDPPSQMQVAEALREADPQAFLFWVSFMDGTSEKSIEDLFHEIKGTKKGPINSGWYPVEVKLPKPEPPDQFLESVKRATIVKAVATSRIMPPAQ